MTRCKSVILTSFFFLRFETHQPIAWHPILHKDYVFFLIYSGQTFLIHSMHMFIFTAANALNIAAIFQKCLYMNKFLFWSPAAYSYQSIYWDWNCGHFSIKFTNSFHQKLLISCFYVIHVQVLCICLLYDNDLVQKHQCFYLCCHRWASSLNF